MDLMQMKYYIAVVQTGSINGAAKKLKMTQPPISMQMRLLEEELGSTLFLRGNRRIRLTEEGEVFYRHALQILNMTESAVTAVADCHRAAGGTLRIGTVSSLIDLAIEKWFSGFSAAHPGVNFQLSEGNTYQVLERLRNRQLDAALVRTPFSTRGVCCYSLSPEDMLAFGTKKYLGSMGERISLQQLAGLPLVLYRRWADILDKAFATGGYTPRVLCTADDARTCISWANAGLGVAIAPLDIRSSYYAASLESRTILGLAPTAQTTLVTNEEGCDTAIGSAFVAYFKRSNDIR